jgi:hypothetical protein
VSGALLIKIKIYALQELNKMKYKVYLWIYKSNGRCYCREYKNIQGETHREDGPAIEYTKEPPLDDLNYYFLNNRKYSEKEYWKKIKRI